MHQAINAFAPIFRTVQSKVDLDQVLGLQAFDLNRVLDVDPEFLDEDAEHQVRGYVWGGLGWVFRASTHDGGRWFVSR
jgi:G3E family GTPase